MLRVPPSLRARFTDGRKVFLRTELRRLDSRTPHDPRIAALFAKACYFTGESIRDAELARDADRAYNTVAAAHWTGVLPPTTEPVVHKSAGTSSRRKKPLRDGVPPHSGNAASACRSRRSSASSA